MPTDGWIDKEIVSYICIYIYVYVFPGGSAGKEPACQCRRAKRWGFDPWVRKIPWRRARQPTPVFFSGKLYGQRSLAGYNWWGCKSWTWLSTSAHTHTRLCLYRYIKYIKTAIKTKEILPFATAWLDLKGIRLGEIERNNAEKDIYYMISYICGI